MSIETNYYRFYTPIIGNYGIFYTGECGEWKAWVMKIIFKVHGKLEELKTK